MHDESRQGIRDGEAPGLAGQCQPAAEDDDFGMEQVDDMRKSKSEVAGGAVEDFSGERAIRSKGRAEHPCFGAARICRETRKDAPGFARSGLTHLLVHSPARTAFLNDRALPVETQMPEFRLPRFCSVIDFPADDESPADTAPGIGVKDRGLTHARSERRLAECGDVRVVVHDDRDPCQFPQPPAERKILPALNVVRAADLARRPIHGPSVADTDGAPLEFRLEPPDRGLDLPANPLSPEGSIHRQLLAVHDAAVAGSRDQLQLAAADFNAEKVHEATQRFEPFCSITSRYQ